MLRFKRNADQCYQLEICDKERTFRIWTSIFPLSLSGVEEGEGALLQRSQAEENIPRWNEKVHPAQSSPCIREEAPARCYPSQAGTREANGKHIESEQDKENLHVCLSRWWRAMFQYMYTADQVLYTTYPHGECSIIQKRWFFCFYKWETWPLGQFHLRWINSCHIVYRFICMLKSWWNQKLFTQGEFELNCCLLID